MSNVFDTKYKAHATLKVDSIVTNHIMKIEETPVDDDVDMNWLDDDIESDYN